MPNIKVSSGSIVLNSAIDTDRIYINIYNSNAVEYCIVGSYHEIGADIGPYYYSDDAHFLAGLIEVWINNYRNSVELFDYVVYLGLDKKKI